MNALPEIEPQLSELEREVARALGRSPTTAELLDLLAWGVRALPDRAVIGADPSRFVGLRARYRRGVKAQESPENRVGELNDAAWNTAAELVAVLARNTGGPLHSDVLLERILAAMHRVAQTRPTGIEPTDITALVPVVRRGKARPKPGDIVAIPAGSSGYVRAVMVADNAFGTALGIFVDIGEPRLPSSAMTAPVLRHPVYTDDEQVILGRWLVVGHSDELLERFPSAPELLQAPWAGGPGDRGEHEHGQARSPDGPRRPLTVEEARDAGIHIEGYRESFMSEELEAWLPEMLRQRAR